MNKNIINLAIASLPKELIEDIFFQELCNQIPNDIEIYEKIAINKSLYKTYISVEPNLANYFKPQAQENNLLDLILFSKTFLLTMSIKKEENAYLINLTINDGITTTIYFTKTKTTNKVKITTIKKHQNVIEDYKVEVIYYDQNYQRINIPASKKEALKAFSNFFLIPEELSAYFYQNYPKYQKELNRAKIIGEMELEAKTRPLSEEYAFLSPTTINSLKEYLSIFNINNNKELNQNLNTIFNKLAAYLKDNLIIISTPLFDNILKYISGLTLGLISTRGIIIAKKANYYNLYNITITNNNVDITSTIIDHQELKELFNLNPLNSDNELLKEFLDLSR